ncbi:MAG: polyamine aminopropyltransferase [Acidobacteria bacterium]|nr:polyamine aminopropyltransferase [Acidobacteriota bacterium]
MESFLWFEEESLGQARKFAVSESLFRGKSEFQQVEIIQTVACGRMLLLDGLVMCSERDEFVYHEMISHVPLFTHPDPKSVLIIGGGDGGTAREVLRHKSVQHCTMVEIDGLVIEACRQHLQQTACALDDPRLNLIVGDGVAFVANSQETFDVIIVDSTDPVGMAAPLFGESFYQNVNRILSSDGIVVAQAESPYFHPEQQKAVLSRMANIFARVHLYNYYNLTYPGNTWGFAFATKGLCPIQNLDLRRVEQSGLEMQYYTTAMHRAAFALPAFQQRALAECLSPLTL